MKINDLLESISSQYSIIKKLNEGHIQPISGLAVGKWKYDDFYNTIEIVYWLEDEWKFEELGVNIPEKKTYNLHLSDLEDHIHSIFGTKFDKSFSFTDETT